MAEGVEHITDDEERVAAAAWLARREQYAVTQDPFAKPIRKPKIKLPGYSEIQEFRKQAWVWFRFLVITR